MENDDRSEIDRSYQIVRFSKTGRRKVVRRYLTLGEAQRWCSRPDTHSKGNGPRAWFHGFERMK